MKNKILILASIFTNFTFSQISKFDVDNRNYKEIKVDYFNKISVSDKINAEIVIVADNEQQRVEISSTEKDADLSKIKIVTDDDELEIKKTFFSSISGEKVFVKIYTPSYKIEEIISSLNSKIISRDSIFSKKELSVEAYTGGTIDLNINVTKLEVKSSTGGKVRLSGKAKKQEIEVSTGSHYYGKNLITEETELEMILGGDADVFATERLKVDAGSSGAVNYYGSPKSKDLKGNIVKEIK